MTDIPAPLTIVEVAALLRCQPRSVRGIPAKLLPYVKPGRERLYARASVQAYLEGRQQEIQSCGSSPRRAVRTSKPGGITRTGQAESLVDRRARKRAARLSRKGESSKLLTGQNGSGGSAVARSLPRT